MPPAMPLEPSDRFAPRHLGPRPGDIEDMVQAVGASSLDGLIDDVLPAAIRLSEPLTLPDPETEAAYLERLRELRPDAASVVEPLLRQLGR